MDINLETDPLGRDNNGNPVYLKEIWPSSEEIQEALSRGMSADIFKSRYSHVFEDAPEWNQIPVTKSAQYPWEPDSTYIQQPPYFENFSTELPDRIKLEKMRPLAIFGDSITTDHISPAGSIRKDSAAGLYLQSLGVDERDFNSYGSRRGNHHIMMRGTFANVRTRNQMANGVEGGYTVLMPEGTLTTIFDASEIYHERKVPLIVLAGKDYGMGSSRDWAAKGTALLGVKVVIATSFERIHRSNLIGMGILPLQFLNDESPESLGLKGDALYSIDINEEDLVPQKIIRMRVDSPLGSREISLLSRLDTSSEVDYYKNGGILPFVLRNKIDA